MSSGAKVERARCFPHLTLMAPYEVSDSQRPGRKLGAWGGALWRLERGSQEHPWVG